jgi:CTP synthase
MQMLELPESVHPYFVGTQAHPCLTSRPLSPDGMFLGLVNAALRRADPQGTLEGVSPPKAPNSVKNARALAVSGD